MESKAFIDRLKIEFSNEDIKHTKLSVEKLARTFGIENKNLVKEYSELALVLNARGIAHDATLSIKERYSKIVATYRTQVNISMRTSQSVLLQQYSTPSPISFLASSYIIGSSGLSGYKAFKQLSRSKKGEIIVGNAHNSGVRIKPTYFESSAGNGLLTIALPYSQTYVNELDDVRYDNLKMQPFARVTKQDATLPFFDYIERFDGVLTNPPFGKLLSPIKYDGFEFKVLDHAMCINTLVCMKDTGRAALIIGGHTTWDKMGRPSLGKNRLFLNYLYRHYNVEDVIPINGKKLYTRQGTGMSVRLILINGRKAEPQGAAPLRDELLEDVVNTFDDLWQRVGLGWLIGSDREKKKKQMQLRAKAILILQNQKDI